MIHHHQVHATIDFHMCSRYEGGGTLPTFVRVVDGHGASVEAAGSGGNVPHGGHVHEGKEPRNREGSVKDH